MESRESDIIEKEGEVSSHSFVKMSSKIIDEGSEKVPDDCPRIVIGDDDSPAFSDSIITDQVNIKSCDSMPSIKNVQSDELTADLDSHASVQLLDDDEQQLADSSLSINLGTSSDTFGECRKNSADEDVANKCRTIPNTVLESKDQLHDDCPRLVDADDQSHIASAVYDGSATSTPPDDAEQLANTDVPSNHKALGASPCDAEMLDQSDAPITVVPLDDEDELEVDSVLGEDGERLVRVRKREEPEVENEEQEKRESLVGSENLTEGILNYLLKKISQFGLNPLLVCIDSAFRVIHSFSTAS